MKIAVVRQKYALYGGAENFSLEFIRQLAAAGHEVHIFANQWTGEAETNIFFHKVPALRINSWLRVWSFAWFARRLLSKERFDVIQSHERTWRQDVYRAGDGCHKEWLEQRGKYLSGFRRWQMKWSPFHRLVLKIERALFAPGNYKKIVAISDLVKKNIHKHYAVPDEDVVVVYNGVDLERFHPDKRALHRDAVRDALRVPKDAVLFLCVGSGFERKGVRFLLEATQYLDAKADWRILVVGKGNWERYLKYAPERLRPRLIYREPVKDLERYYAAADAFVLPSIYEPFGNVNLEALASGLPVVTTRFCGAADIIEHGINGLIVEDPGNREEIAANMNRLMRNEEREGMGRLARIVAEKFPPSRNTGAMLGLYKELSAISCP